MSCYTDGMECPKCYCIPCNCASTPDQGAATSGGSGEVAPDGSVRCVACGRWHSGWTINDTPTTHCEACDPVIGVHDPNTPLRRAFMRGIKAVGGWTDDEVMYAAILAYPPIPTTAGQVESPEGKR